MGLISTGCSTRIPRHVTEPNADRGLIDTSVVMGLESIHPGLLPSQVAISAITLAELAAGPHATDDLAERARRQQRLQLTEATLDAIPFDAGCARAYGRVYAQTVQRDGRREAAERSTCSSPRQRSRWICRCIPRTRRTSPALTNCSPSRRSARAHNPVPSATYDGGGRRC